MMSKFFSKWRTHKSVEFRRGSATATGSTDSASSTKQNKENAPDAASSNKNSTNTKQKPNNKQSNQSKQFQFHCQLAHGSPTGIVSGFNNAKELYQKIAECFGIDPSTILFCTLNTHKIDMDKLLGAQIGLEDLIFAHVKGQPKEIDILKSEEALGLTITDNGAGCSFIKRIKEGSVIDRLSNVIKPGDHIEKIDGKILTGMRHVDVALALKSIPVGTTFKLRLIEPNAFLFHIEPPNRTRKTNDVRSGKKTLRFTNNGQANIEDADDVMDKAIEQINRLLETYMGIYDSDLARQIWDIAQNKDNPSDFAETIDASEIGQFGFTDNFIYDLWGAIGDIRDGRIPETVPTQKERL